jgi:3-methyladenine DNA glycosylase AlkD
MGLVIEDWLEGGLNMKRGQAGSMSTFNAEKILEQLASLADPDANLEKAGVGIKTAKSYGIKTLVLREIARQIGKDHLLALKLWDSGISDARHLACMVDAPAMVDESQMEAWALDFDSWDVTDSACFGLFRRTPFAYDKAVDWSQRIEEFVKRGGFAIMAGLAVHDKSASDERFLNFLLVIERESDDDRNFVKKAVNWALRSIGKRSISLNRAALDTAVAIQQRGTRAGRWIAADALKELTGDKVQARLEQRQEQQR